MSDNKDGDPVRLQRKLAEAQHAENIAKIGMKLAELAAQPGRAGL
jgi:hypothetical protein